MRGSACTDALRGALQPQPLQRGGEARARVVVHPPELGKAGREQLGVTERDERLLDAGAPEEAHGRRVELGGIRLGDQHEQRGGLLELDVLQLAGRGARGQEVSPGQRAAESGERRSLDGHEHTFVSHRECCRAPEYVRAATGKTRTAVPATRPGSLRDES